MNNFIFNYSIEDGILHNLAINGDPFETDFLLSFGEVCGTDSLSVSREWKECEISGRQALTLTITFSNNSEDSVTVSPRFPIAANTDYVAQQDITYYKRVMAHPCICGCGSFIVWCRPCGEGSSVILACLGDTSLTDELNTSPVSYVGDTFTLSAGENRVIRFALFETPDFGKVREILYDIGSPDISVFPSLTIPDDLALRLRVRRKDCKDISVSCDDALIEHEGEIYTLRFTSHGEKKITVNADGAETFLTAYSTSPVSKLIDSRSAHIVGRQQYRGDKWYNGMFSQWNMKERFMTTPENKGELCDYMVCADDPGLCKAPYVAEKNVIRPDKNEIESVEYYIEHFLWGGLQRDESEGRFAYAVIGSDNWKQNRESGSGFDNGGHGEERMWRTFDYTHIIQLYWNMYLIAKAHPEMVHYLDAAGYLERARKTAHAFFEVPYSIFMRDGWAFRGWCDWAFKQGNFHEKYLIPLIEECGDEELRYYWETKVKYMIFDNPLPYGSEMWFDTTAFESTEAVAHYALVEGVSPDTNGWYDKNLDGPGEGGFRSHTAIPKDKLTDFASRQMKANLASRGQFARTYDMLGSDYRAGGYKEYRLSYMSQMGGAAVLDYALNFSDNPAPLFRIAFASLLAPWCLINTGEDDFFHPHTENEGAAGWAFQPENNGKCFGGFMRCNRGPWPYDGEIDSGFSGAINAMCTVAVSDDDFGDVAYCGELTKEKDGSITIIPHDGVNREVYSLIEGLKAHIRVDVGAIECVKISQSK